MLGKLNSSTNNQFHKKVIKKAIKIIANTVPII